MSWKLFLLGGCFCHTLSYKQPLSDEICAALYTLPPATGSLKLHFLKQFAIVFGLISGQQHIEYLDCDIHQVKVHVWCDDAAEKGEHGNFTTECQYEYCVFQIATSLQDFDRQHHRILQKNGSHRREFTEPEPALPHYHYCTDFHQESTEPRDERSRRQT